MRIAVASGKGGTGKTAVATSLAMVLSRPDSGDGSAAAPPRVLLRDCDVETPNAHLYLRPRFDARVEVGPPVPAVNEELCTRCGRCAEVCEYNAITVLEDRVLLFPDLCHGCGLCPSLCPEGAMTEVPRLLGILEAGRCAAGPRLAHGVLHTGEALAVPVIRGLKQWDTFSTGGGTGPEPPAWDHIIIDSPPGTTCPVVEAMRGSDAALLVTEPTPFGLHDLRLIAEVVTALRLPAAVIVNRDGTGYEEVDRFCAGTGLEIALRIPFSREIAAGTARGISLVEIVPELVPLFAGLPARLARIAAGDRP